MTAPLHDELVRALGDKQAAAPVIHVAGPFVDLNGDGVDESVLLWTHNASAYRLSRDHWQRVGDMYGSANAADSLLPHLIGK